MRYTNLFGKTLKSSKEYNSKNATLLIKGGFIDQTMSGVYTYLPLGLRVLSKIEQIVREEMDKIGCEMLMPSIVPMELWETSGRLTSVDILFKASAANDRAKDLNDAEYILSPTHEEVITPIAKKFNCSYKDLPFAIYQIQTKFRNEARPKSGLMRAREFRMKDLYSFHRSEQELKDYYELSKEAYMKVYERLGLKDITYLSLASGGDFTKDYSHEFQTRCETGEDTVFYVPSTGVAYNREVAPSKAPETNWDIAQKPMEAVFGEHITGMDALVDFLGIPAEKCVKTLIYETSDGRVIAAGVRGDYDINEDKLRKVASCDSLQLASEEIVNKTTGAVLGYAGLVGLPDDIEFYVDDALKNAVNFECGANKDNYHNINVNWNRDVKKPDTFYDLKLAKDGDYYPETNELYEVFNASEVGNIFPLNVKFSKAFNYTYTDEAGDEKPVYMGSYGLGTSRVMGVLVEIFNDEKGIIWPEAIAPFKVHLVGLNLDDNGVLNKAEKVHLKLENVGVEVLFDDRLNISAGEKFADADLIGIPYRVVVSKKTGDLMELKKRSDDSAGLINLEKLLRTINENGN